MALLTIPLQNDIGNFNERLTLDGVDFVLDFQYNGRLDRWFMSIKDADEVVLIDRIKVNKDVNWFLQFNYKEIPQGDMIAFNFEDAEEPNLENFSGSVNILYQEAI